MLKPIFSNKLISALNQIQKARDTNKLVIFAGSGVSAPSGVPTWKPFCEKMISTLSNSKNLIGEKDPLKLAQLLYNELGDKLYNDFVRSTLLYNKTTYNQLHSSVFSLKPAHIVTTNYDDHFEQIINQDSLSYSIVKKDQDLPYADFHNLVIKMHGDFNELNMVLKEDDYLNYSSNFPLIEGFVKALFTNHTILFVGYSFSDIDLKAILQSVKRILGEHTPPAYIFLPDKISLNEIKYLENKGLVPIYSDLITFENHLEVPFTGKDYNVVSPWATFFSGDMNTKFNFFNEKLSFLKFLVDFNEFNFSLSNQSIFQQTNKSFKRFDGVLRVDKSAISNIFPFNAYDSVCVENTLYTSSQEIHTLIDTFGEVLGFLEGKYNGGIQHGYTESEMRSINDFIFYLNKSGIYYLSKNKFDDNSKLLIIGTPYLTGDDSNLGFDIIKSYFSFDFCGVAKILETYLLPQQSAWSHKDYIYNLTIAYFYYKFGEYQISWDIIDKARKSAKRSNNHVIYFVCLVCLNKISKHFRNHSLYSFDELNRSESYDLDKICEGLPVDDDLRIVLRTIKHLDYDFSEFSIAKELCRSFEMRDEGIIEYPIDITDFEVNMLIISFGIRSNTLVNVTDLFGIKDTQNEELLNSLFELCCRKIVEAGDKNKENWVGTLIGLTTQYILNGAAINLYYFIEKFKLANYTIKFPEEYYSKAMFIYIKFLRLFDDQTRAKKIEGFFPRDYLQNVNSNFILIFSIFTIEDNDAFAFFERLFSIFDKKVFCDCIEPYALEAYIKKYLHLLDKQMVARLSKRYEFDITL